MRSLLFIITKGSKNKTKRYSGDLRSGFSDFQGLAVFITYCNSNHHYNMSFFISCVKFSAQLLKRTIIIYYEINEVNEKNSPIFLGVKRDKRLMDT
jgi:hypothetical protein